ncbi:NAD-P-binding protein [Trametes coccinea BRFM310]|uniref:NAD-P-binding protein n=1 Tax=Trametes coccinea (strain BRFM310) TaxID=1353009 RepID=A0A1Y2J386_TRAC3|nr:NAD-P-binding protein [Trametes coccinea BRFM310]
MPAVTSGKVLITGANGYIAVWIAKTLLDSGFAVRGTVRSESKATHLRGLFKSAGDKFEVVIVEDISKVIHTVSLTVLCRGPLLTPFIQEGAFNDFIEDVVAIVHNATPVHLNAVEPDEMIIPAVQGTLEILQSAHLRGTSIQRIVVLSSTATVWRSNPDPSRTLDLDETCWNDEEVTQCHELGRDASPLAKYRASKTLAERAAWDFMQMYAGEGALQWDLVALNPSFVVGPVLHEVDRPENLGWTAKEWYDKVVRGQIDIEAMANTGEMYVDVRDIAQAHVLALRTPAAGGNRFIISAGPFKWQDFVSIAHRLDEQIPAGNTDYHSSKAYHPVIYNSNKSIGELGMEYRSMEETTQEILKDCRARGWL